MPTTGNATDSAVRGNVTDWGEVAATGNATGNATGGAARANVTDWVAFYEERVPFDFDSVIVFLVFMTLLAATVQGIKMVERRARRHAHRYAPVQTGGGSKVVREVELTEVDMEPPEGTDEDLAWRANV